MNLLDDPVLASLSAALMPHLGHLLAVNAEGTSGTVPGTDKVGMQIKFLVLHCQQCDVDLLRVNA